MFGREMDARQPGCNNSVLEHSLCMITLLYVGWSSKHFTCTSSFSGSENPMRHYFSISRVRQQRQKEIKSPTW